MQKWLIGTAVVIVALGVGVGGAYALAKVLPSYINTDQAQNNWQGEWQKEFWCKGSQPGNGFGNFGPGMTNRGGRTGNFGPGMMYSQPGYNTQQIGERITIDDAQAKAEAYAASIGNNLRVAEVMEFENNFYAVVVETDTNKGAFELLIDPYSGYVTPEMGPNHMWNTKYGRMRIFTDVAATNAVTMTDAAAAAQKALDERINGATLHMDGIDFYGYYTFDYSIDGNVAGMLSVNGSSGQVWFHNWHGAFITEKEITK